ncbi:Leucine Rich repeat-containing protein [Streptomyces sp. DvalAA-14]|uniref:STM4015 family protein n=1 Tax=unclassified Streptomyces TaxID=2593676 RepID=UPI00081B0693|nr:MULTISPECIES: STM4015 family protein [unclassified Streptomyces]MYS19056.1 leucine-rich repeat domain-containing protein [Streptomyces sp. SID4948]SCD35350.1 Leucine Rich repeat-containing protein [Streptomyces sp. DvalAA-14]
MTIGNHLQDLDGLPAFDFGGVRPEQPELPEADAVAWRITGSSYGDDETWPEAFNRFTGTVDVTRVRALIVGAWSDPFEEGPEEVAAALLAVRDRLPALRALFIGDMVMEECEISWIKQGDVTPFLDAFPDLETFGVRGGTGLVFTAVRHDKLRSLTVETGGMPAHAVRGVAASDFPALEHLDLWLGTSEYGGNCELADLAPFFAGTRLPALRSLALRDSEIQDEIAAGFAAAPVVARLETLDLSMGVLTDDGAAALLGGQPLTHLKTLDLHHNYFSDGVNERLREALEPAGVQLELDPDSDDEDLDEDGTVWRFVAVGE